MMYALIRNEVFVFQEFFARQYCNIALNYEAKTICGLKEERWKHSKKECSQVIVVEVGCKST
jgi:hypothetical protein